MMAEGHYFDVLGSLLERFLPSNDGWKKKKCYRETDVEGTTTGLPQDDHQITREPHI